MNNYLVEDNIAYAAGPFLVGGGRPSHGIRVRENTLHGVQMRIGYGDTRNEDCEVTDNLIVNADLAVQNFSRRRVERNRVYKDGKPGGVEVRILPNRYDADRAHVAVLNWDQKPTVALDLSTFLRADDYYRLMNPRDLFGKPTVEGSFERKPVDVPVTGEFAAFVLLRQPKRE